MRQYHPQKRQEDFIRRSGDDGELIESLHHLDGRSYGSYKSLLGSWNYGSFTIEIDRIQADPYAPPSSLRVVADPRSLGFPAECLETEERQIATADFLVRAFEKNIKRFSRPGVVQIVRTGQEILERSACTVRPTSVELRFQVQFPARGRTIMGHQAAQIFDRDVPDIVLETLDFRTPSDAPADVAEALASYIAALRAHVHTYEDYCALQGELTRNNWIAFIADGAILARHSGVSQYPMDGAVPFESPDTLREHVTLPHAGDVSGMALRPGITVIVGGGYHGKSTLLSAVQRGVYAHVPGDGRELVAATPNAVKVRAADGRAVTGVNVSPFITHLPGGADTTRFSTENASGSTSQAAAIVEAVELGSPLLLIDEDTSATNLLIRDSRMRELVHAEKEPITPLVDRIDALAKKRGVSTIMVMGGSGDYLDVADLVLMMDNYRCLDVTERARSVVADQPRERTDAPDFPAPVPRVLARTTKRADKPKTKVSGTDRIQLDKQSIDLLDVEQIVDAGQTESIAWAVRGIVEHIADGAVTLPDALAQVEARIDAEGLDALRSFGMREHPAFLARPRMVDVGAALNRYRRLALA
ncbi:MAG: ABC-ATPase domain-containing protein [Ancrocorticia sp.]|jgi:predicted ABC-class ATPase|nr:ABC-ATPase domain-containing protein [Ancrocorticia sp.]MCI2003107.1 ABC-ATPase domain-containing protein [Ancrocorticia sp.]MCI2030332.1 ABC-ATPase domain-containing protein [Ancrocorticia sp.]MCI2193658.1 ABC-ATPase domain-containing protein [Ancrocorticia sp.]MCI2199713.1 ABC-ATPase domain-containing protein [Ancrocorticia sp.]